MSGKTLKFNNIRVNKKEFHNCKQPIHLKLVTVNQIVVSDKFKDSDDGFKYFIGYQKDEIVKPLCIILPQMSEYIKYFEKIWDKIKEKLNINFHRMPVYDETYIKAKIKELSRNIKTNFLGDENSKENMHYACIACITIDSVMKIEKKNYLQVYLEECKYRVKKIQMSRFINARLESDSESDSETESKSDTELMAKLKSSSDSE